MKSGFCGILGRPNAGKSTLINAMLSKKVSIVTPRAQTTRDVIMGVYNEKDLQIVFIDTPGLFEGNVALDKTMQKTALKSIKDVDCVLYLIDSSVTDFSIDDKLIHSLKTSKPVFLVLNKIDLATVTMVEALQTHYQETFPSYKLLQISALTNYGLKALKDAVVSCLPDGPAYYPNDYVSDKDHSFMIREVVRQQCLHFLDEEVPHQSAVAIEDFKEDSDHVKCHATIYVEKINQKAIVIGKGGQMIKKISMSSRHELEKMWHKNVTLVCEVEYAPNWRNDPQKLKKLGYGEQNDQ